MSNDKKPNYYKKDEQQNVFMDVFEVDDNTQHLLKQEKTRYTKGANDVIIKVQREYLEKKRKEEIDLALENWDKQRFMALTSEGWEDIL